jgi:hypothetical protein
MSNREKKQMKKQSPLTNLVFTNSCFMLLMRRNILVKGKKLIQFITKKSAVKGVMTMRDDIISVSLLLVFQSNMEELNEVMKEDTKKKMKE